MPTTEYAAFRNGESEPWITLQNPRVAEAISKAGHRVTAETRGAT